MWKWGVCGGWEVGDGVIWGWCSEGRVEPLTSNCLESICWWWRGGHMHVEVGCVWGQGGAGKWGTGLVQ